MPLRQLYPGVKSTALGNAAKVDIIAVPELSPQSKNVDHAWDTWRTPAGPQGRLWLRDDLPQYVPESRIFFYEYYSTPVFGKDKTTFIDIANVLLEEIRLRRHEASKRPILFLGHSIGGLLIKQALINAQNNPRYRPIKDATTGLAFFATPHYSRDLSLVSQKGIMAKIATALESQKGDNIVETLKELRISIDIIQEQWRHQLVDYNFISFWGDLDSIVLRESAQLGLPGDREMIVRLHADHSTICKFGSTPEDQNNLELVCSNIRGLSKAATEIRATIQGLRDILTEGPLQGVRPVPEPGDSYNTWFLDIWAPASSARGEGQLPSQFNIRHVSDLLSEDASNSTADPSPVPEPIIEEYFGTEEDFLTEHIRTDSDDSDLISLVYDKIPKSVSEEMRKSFHVIVRKYKADQPTWSQRPCPLFRDPILSKVGILLGIPSGFASVTRGSDGGSCIRFGNSQTYGYLIQTPFYSDFEGFWSLSIKWSEANAKSSKTHCSQILAVLEVNGDLPRKVLLDVHRLSRDHPHPVYLLTRLLEQHIEDSVVKFEKITRRIAEIERSLRQDLSRPQSLSHVDETLQNHQRLNAVLHNCSIDVVDLEKRRHFEKEMSREVKILVHSILQGYEEVEQPQACMDLKQRMDLFHQIAESRDLDITSLPRRISTQMNVLYNQIAQRDAWVNLDIAKATRDDNVVMIQDSNAMKTIAVLTTLFLPGTFIASIMSTSMFSFADNEIYLSNKFWLYWSLTIPLTVIIVTSLLIWMRVMKNRLDKRQNENNSQQGGDMESGPAQGPIPSPRWPLWKSLHDKKRE